jgi:hypothetical protein
VVKPGFCQRGIRQTNERQRHINELPISVLLGEVDSIQTDLKRKFVKKNFGKNLAFHIIIFFTRKKCMFHQNYFKM